MYNSTSNYLNQPQQPEGNIHTTFDENHKVNFPTTSEVYNAVFENAFHPMYMGSDDGRIFKFNKKLSKILEYSEKEMMEKGKFEIFDVSEKAFLDFLNERNKKGIAKAEITCIKKSGERLPCHISSVLYKTNQGEKRSLNTIIAMFPKTIADRRYLNYIDSTD